MWLLLLLALFYKTEAEGTHYVECGLPKHKFKMNKDNRIIGGWEANPHSVPWQVRLHLFNIYGRVDAYCGGSLIRFTPVNHTKLVLTAAHCLRRTYGYRPPSDIDVVVGRHDFRFPGGKVLRVDRFTYDDYNHDTKSRDIALLQLAEPVTFTDDVLPVCLPTSGESPPKGVPCYISGWGLTSTGGSLSPTLQVVDVKILEDKDCEMDEETKIGSLCAGDMEGGKDACVGDSGGPLVCLVKGRFFLYGITSYGVGCGEPKKPGVYTEVSRYIHWLEKQSVAFDLAFAPYTDSIYLEE